MTSITRSNKIMSNACLNTKKKVKGKTTNAIKYDMNKAIIAVSESPLSKRLRGIIETAGGRMAKIMKPVKKSPDLNNKNAINNTKPDKNT